VTLSSQRHYYSCSSFYTVKTIGLSCLKLHNFVNFVNIKTQLGIISV